MHCVSPRRTYYVIACVSQTHLTRGPLFKGIAQDSLIFVKHWDCIYHMVSSVFPSYLSKPWESWWQQVSRAARNAWHIEGAPILCWVYDFGQKQNGATKLHVVGKPVWKANSKKLRYGLSNGITTRISAQPLLWRAIFIGVYEYGLMAKIQTYKCIFACLVPKNGFWSPRMDSPSISFLPESCPLLPHLFFFFGSHSMCSEFQKGCQGLKEGSVPTCALTVSLVQQTFTPKLVLLDLSDISCVQDVAKEVLDCYGCVDILINNASIKVKGPAHKITLELDKKIMDANYFGPITLTKGLVSLTVLWLSGIPAAR